MEIQSLNWDLIVIGGGTAGIVAAKTAVGLGARTLLVEQDRTGGDCLWTGCVPSKSLLAAAHVAAGSKFAGKMGIVSTKSVVNFPEVMGYVKSAINEISPQDSVQSLEEAGVHVFKGEAKFDSPKSIAINGVTHHFRKAIIATGAYPAVPPIPGLRESNYLTSENIWQLQELPKKLVIVGAGSIGSELGQAFSRLGSEVTLVDGADRILPREDKDASEILKRQLNFEGIEIITSAVIKNIQTNPIGEGSILLDTPHESEKLINFDRILIAIGRTPRTSQLALESAGIQVNKAGFIVVSSSLRSTNKKVWAAGDVTGHPQFTHVAGVHGSTAASNAILGLSRKAEVSVIPRVTFTDPEIAAVGISTLTQDSKMRVLERSNTEVDRAITESRHLGTTKIVIDSKGRIVGGLVVGPCAGENLAEITLAIKMKLSTRDLASTIHPYPTFGDGIWNIAIADVRNQLSANYVKILLHLLKVLAKIRN